MHQLRRDDTDWPVSAQTVAFVVVLVGLKALLLFVALPYFHHTSSATYQADRFPDWYDMLATNLIDGHGYRFYPDTTLTMVRTPGWVLVLAVIFSVFGPSLAAVKMFNLLCSIGTAWITYALGQRITNNRLIAALAAAIYFLHPATIIADSRGGVESFLTLAIMTFMLLVFRALESERVKDYVKAGFALGIALLIKSTAAVFPFGLLVYLVALKPSVVGIRQAVVRLGAMALVAGAVLSPWIVRNYAISHRFVPTMNVGGMAAYVGMYIATHSDTGRQQWALDLEASEEMGKIAQEMGLRFKPGYYPQFYSVSDESNFYEHLGDLVKRRYEEHPSIFLKVIAFNARGFWVQGRTFKATKLNMILVIPFLALALFGAYLGWRQSLPFVVPIVLFVIVFFVAHLPIEGQARYQVPLIPVLSLLVGISVNRIVQMTLARRHVNV